MRPTLRQRARGARLVIDAWNHHFFMPRYIYFQLSKVQRVPRRDGSYRHRSESEDDTDSSPIRLEDEDNDEDTRYATLRRRRNPVFTYRLSCLSLASRSPMTGPAPASGPPGYWHNVIPPSSPPGPYGIRPRSPPPVPPFIPPTY
jgi:hypothetical protein